MNQVQNDDQRNHKYDKSNRKCRILRCSRNSLRTVDYDFTGSQIHTEIVCARDGEMETVCIPADIENINNILDDLTESQRYDCQVVASQTKYRNADQESEDSRHNAADNDGNDKSEKVGHRPNHYF